MSEHAPNPIQDESAGGTWMQAHHARTRAQEIVETEDIGFRKRPDGTGLYIKRRPSGGNVIGVRRMSIVSLSDNYMMCNPYTSGSEVDTSKPPVAVAKDATFRGTSPRFVSGAGLLQVQQTLDPDYAVGGTIYALFGVGGKTDAYDANNAIIDAIEVGPSRQWSDPWQRVCVSIGGVRHEMLVRGTSIIPGT
jgi:hypothetical protein